MDPQPSAVCSRLYTGAWAGPLRLSCEADSSLQGDGDFQAVQPTPRSVEGTTADLSPSLSLSQILWAPQSALCCGQAVTSRAGECFPVQWPTHRDPEGQAHSPGVDLPSACPVSGPLLHPSTLPGKTVISD